MNLPYGKEFPKKKKRKVIEAPQASKIENRSRFAICIDLYSSDKTEFSYISFDNHYGQMCTKPNASMYLCQY